MEKLEAALAKAREMRKSTLGTPRVDREPVSPKVMAAGDWLSLPEFKLTPARLQRNRITAILGGKDATPYDMLRSRTIRLMREKEWSRLAVTSPGPACGKTTVALNLALSLSRQKDLRVMLFDLDLRRPALHKVAGLTPKHSFHEVLDGRIAFEDQAVRIGENLILAMNATACRNPSELLQASGTGEVLDEIERRWQPDVMLFDMSPMLASDDNVGFLGNVDCALLIVAAERTTLPNIDVCEKELAQLTNVLGIVLNKCRYADKLVGYSYDSYS
ncbi:CpsD/CapB family tyrosine-protein kinase [Defluviimonas sp. WL0050]|uniref:CpsD/CapB family tyrosine-protein kinase n=1 Tax=Albidovulum litorale TaxID=2984134 RepID=A0ABT2ZRI9_9RHOB|nr:CpsD/CapB family tyrosine-protein kinase [Defluviimonas sp. WL0050]MCV2873774.1 CpsD/CapB family tyrosine-protein kinase [Defluviimonas sp. WL0050]